MSDGIELLNHRVKCPHCREHSSRSSNVVVRRTETSNQGFISNVPGVMIMTTHYECLDCGHKFNIGIKIEGLKTEVILDECL